MKRFLGIDFGLKRTGLAITDENNIIASALTTVETKEVMEYLKRLIPEKNIGVIALGEPKKMDLTDSHSTQNVYLFKEALIKSFPAIEIVLIDERFTSKIAAQTLYASGLSKKKRKQKGLIDEVSATLILQSYLSQIH